LPEEVLMQCLAQSLQGSEFGQEIIAKNLFNSQVHRSSLSRAKNKFKPELFSKLLLEQASRLSKWHGHRVHAVDGSWLTLPWSKDIKKTFPKRRGDYYPSALLVTASDVFTGQPIGARVGAWGSSERAMLLELLDEFKVGDVSVLDRGFEGHRVWEKFYERNQFFIARIKRCACSKSLYQLIKRSKKKELIFGYKNLGKIRLIKSGAKRRLVVIATNLVKRRRYKRKELINLYRLRWKAETLYYRMKQYLRVQSWHTKKAQGVRREIMAHLLMLSILAHYVYRASQKLKLNGWALNFKNAIFVLRTCLLVPLSSSALLQSLAQCCYQKQAGRSYPRISKQPQNKWVKRRRAKWYTPN
jgi:hypothetical protein